jgi:hypothetical protein
MASRRVSIRELNLRVAPAGAGASDVIGDLTGDHDRDDEVDVMTRFTALPTETDLSAWSGLAPDCAETTSTALPRTARLLRLCQAMNPLHRLLLTARRLVA